MIEMLLLKAGTLIISAANKALLFRQSPFHFGHGFVSLLTLQWKATCPLHKHDFFKKKFNR